MPRNAPSHGNALDSLARGLAFLQERIREPSLNKSCGELDEAPVLCLPWSPSTGEPVLFSSSFDHQQRNTHSSLLLDTQSGFLPDSPAQQRGAGADANQELRVLARIHSSSLRPLWRASLPS
jgi:hypothetical protein